MLYIAHRINRLRDLRNVPLEYGVEVDLRDSGDRIVLQHDPYISSSEVEEFSDFLREYKHSLIILNVKSERIEWRVLELLRQHGIESYFFLDSSFPMIRALCNSGEYRSAIRFSEFEPIESALALAGQVEWVWVDCFTKLPLEAQSHAALKQHFKLCIVSPELQGRSTDEIAIYAKQLTSYPVDAICSKRPDLWKEAFELHDVKWAR
jgi:hypothetical protein